jgi:hypothetical protein
MDPERFDMMTRLLAPASRRQALPVLASILGVALVPTASSSGSWRCQIAPAGGAGKRTASRWTAAPATAAGTVVRI